MNVMCVRACCLCISIHGICLYVYLYLCDLKNSCTVNCIMCVGDLVVCKLFVMSLVPCTG